MREIEESPLETENVVWRRENRLKTDDECVESGCNNDSHSLV